MRHERTVITCLLFLALGMRPPGTRARCRVCSHRGKTVPRARRASFRTETSSGTPVACSRVFVLPPARPFCRSWVRCVWVWGWGSIARVTRLWLFFFQSLRPLVGLVSWFQRYQIINLSYRT